MNADSGGAIQGSHGIEREPEALRDDAQVVAAPHPVLLDVEGQRRQLHPAAEIRGIRGRRRR